MKWFEIRLMLPKGMVEVVSDRLFELGAIGLDESQVESQGVLRAYFETNSTDKLVEQVRAFLVATQVHFPEAAGAIVSALEVKKEAWETHYQQFFTAQKLSHNFFLVPRWDRATPVPSEYIPISMEAGQAFGTGLHPSTKLTLRMMEGALGHRWNAPKDIRLLDVGTGTGILTIAAYKLGVVDLTAVDTDANAITTAEENFEVNHCKGIKLREGSTQLLNEKFDLIVSNILLQAHVELLSEYQRLLKPGSQLILSGLLTHQIPPLEAAFRESGLVREGLRSLQEWSAIQYFVG